MEKVADLALEWDAPDLGKRARQRESKPKKDFRLTVWGKSGKSPPIIFTREMGHRINRR